MQSSLGAEADITRIGLWGTSFAGGHVLVTAAKEGTNVTAVVSQVRPLTDHSLASRWSSLYTRTLKVLCLLQSPCLLRFSDFVCQEAFHSCWHSFLFTGLESLCACN